MNTEITVIIPHNLEQGEQAIQHLFNQAKSRFHSCNFHTAEGSGNYLKGSRPQKLVFILEPQPLPSDEAETDEEKMIRLKLLEQELAGIIQTLGFPVIGFSRIIRIFALEQDKPAIGERLSKLDWRLVLKNHCIQKDRSGWLRENIGGREYFTVILGSFALTSDVISDLSDSGFGIGPLSVFSYGSTECAETMFQLVG